MIFKSTYGQFALLAAWIIVLLTTLITLYLSEILQLSVCPLCWYQRLCIYPLSLILGIALYRDDRQIYIYTIPLVAMGAVFALYQYLLQMIPGFNPIHFCTASTNEANCADINWQLFGFITLPLLSLISNIVIIILLFLSKDK